MRILALDPAASTGFAFSATKDRVEHSGVWNLGAGAESRPGRLAEMIRIADERWEVETVAYEAATFGTRDFHTMRRHNELAGAIQAACSELGLTCWSFNIGTWKKRSVGSGRADKPAIIRGLRTLFGIEVSRQDEADAIGILLAAQVGPPPEPKKKAAKRIAKAIKAKQQTLFGRR